MLKSTDHTVNIWGLETKKRSFSPKYSINNYCTVHTQLSYHCVHFTELYTVILKLWIEKIGISCELLSLILVGFYVWIVHVYKCTVYSLVL